MAEQEEQANSIQDIGVSITERRPSWKTHPITPALLVALIMGSVTFGGWILSGRAWVESTAKAQAAAAVLGHQAPPVDEVHKSIGKVYVTREAHTKDVTAVKSMITEQGHRIDRTLDRLDSKLDALVQPDRRATGRYTRRRR